MLLVGKTREQVESGRINFLATEIRAERDRRIAAIQWRRERHADEISLGLTPTELIEPILIYIQALRDITKQPGFPETVEWPSVP